MSTRRYYRHSTEFKVRLVQSYLAGEGTIKGLARQHGVYHSLLRLWVEKYRKGHFDEKEVVVEKVEEYEAKISALERKVGQLTMEVDILKKLRERTSPPEGTPQYRERLEALGILGSMARTGNPYDNARVESFFKTLKHEEVYAFEYETMQDVLERLPTFLEETYNRRRLHSSWVCSTRGVRTRIR